MPSHGLITDVSYASLNDLTDEEKVQLQNDVNALFQPKDDPLDISKELKLRAEEELQEDTQKARDNLEALRHLIKEDPVLHSRTDDSFLMAFLRGRKHDVERAYTCIKKYYEFKAKYPDLYVYINSVEHPHLCDQHYFGSLPGLDKKGRKLCVVKPANIDLETMAVMDVFKLGATLLEIMMHDLHLQITGTAVIFDLSNLTILHQAKLATPTLAWHLAMIIQDKIPLRLKAIHVLFQPFYFNAMYAVFKPFLKKKLRKRIFMHGSDMESLHQHIDPEHLPCEWGGERPPFSSLLSRTIHQLNEHKLEEWAEYHYRL